MDPLRCKADSPVARPGDKRNFTIEAHAPICGARGQGNGLAIVGRVVRGLTRISGIREVVDIAPFTENGACREPSIGIEKASRRSLPSELAQTTTIYLVKMASLCNV